ncbi:DNA (cytosine-5-)-methyltransferase [Malacoplasma penetrans]|uniref:Cytosine-specific methyltransferase n=1 Tax=Malacoplasma penetrans (strain HF-2) TaxID=272633 RepID=Q8EUE9_MALP2|nr:DNA (cytosine-5-)-methyltransferase [Malacoplasma penetrans]RXY96821.1 DNA (cytosine-5-)-methyltransferase [Malacoplasma penetrans]BAC44766.1 cytosine-specific DNA methylase [Malacoplasma penetrans HF-2]
MKSIKFIDLFAGIGGFHKALERVAKKNNFNIECVFVSEIDNEAIKTYSSNFSVDKEKIINIRDLDESASQVPDHDFLFAGFPCQTFSNAGKKKGFLDEIRGTLFFDIAKILKNKKPKYILLENVKHLVNHDNGKTWEIIIKTLKEIGYLIPKEPLILSPHEFGIPQERYRVFIPGVLRESVNINEEYINLDLQEYKKIGYIDYSNPIETKNKIKNDFLSQSVNKKYFLDKKNDKDAYLLRVFDAWDEFLKKVKKPEGKTLPVIWTFEFGQNYSLEGLPSWRKKYISDMRSIYEKNKGFIDAWLKKHKVSEWNKREQKFEWQAGKDITSLKDSFIQLRQSGIRCKRPIKFPTLVAMVQIPIIFDYDAKKWRHLTPRETANLQSFPEDFKIYSDLSKNNNDFYSYKQFGNSINVKIASYIQEYLLKNY